MESKGTDRLNIDEIARLAFVSRSVVSRVINNRANVSDEARQRVQKVISAYNYTPSAAARSLATNRSYEINVLMPRKREEALANAYWPLLLMGITEACARRGYLVSLTMVGPDPDDTVNRHVLAGRQFDGYLMVSNQVSHLFAPTLAERGFPMLLIGQDTRHPELSHVDLENVAGGEDATRHLIDLGHRRIAALSGPRETQETRDRLAGYARALHEAGLPAPASYVAEGDYSERSGYEAMQRLLALPSPPTAVFCLNDTMAVGALLSAADAGLDVPGDLSVVGYDDLPVAAYTRPPLTTMRQPIRDMGACAAACLIDRAEGAPTDAPLRRILTAELVVRRSSGPPPHA